MIKSFFLPLDQLSGWPASQVGQLGHHLGKFVTLDVPLHPSFVVPISTLEYIAEKNNLLHQVQEWFQTSFLNPQTSHEVLHARLHKIFNHLIIPAQVSQQFLKEYYATTQEKQVSIVASWIQPAYTHLALQSEAVQGDATVFETLLQTWSQSVWMALRHQESGVQVLGQQDLFPAALIIQSHHLAQLSGFILTTLPSQPKTQYALFLDTMPHQPYMAVDVRTWHVIHEHQFQNKSLKQKKYLTHKQASEITQIAHRIKLHDFQHLKISWEIINDQLYITNLEKLSENSWHQQFEKKHSQMIVIGTTVVAGQASGTVAILKKIPTAQQSFRDKMLVIEELSYLSSHNLEGLKGVIADKSISLAAQLLLKIHHIPTLSHTKTASHRLQNGQKITLDTHHSAVFSQDETSAVNKSPHPTYSKLLRSKIILDVATDISPSELPGTLLHGVLFNSSEVWQAHKTHPLHVAKSSLSYQLQTQLTKTVSSFLENKIPVIYRPMTIPTHQLQKLSHAHQFEMSEINPDFGFYGATRLIHQPEPLYLELQVLQKILKTKQFATTTLQFLIPLTRTPREFHQIQSMLLKHELQSLPLWWEVAFPANLWEFTAYPLDQLQGIIVNITQLHHLLHGLDPSNPDLRLQFDLNLVLIKKALTTLLTAVNPEKVWLQIEDHHQALTILAVDLELAGVIVPQSELAGTRHQLQMAEQDWLMTRKQIH